MSQISALEKEIEDIGGEIFKAIKGDIPSFFDRSHWSGKLMAWAMKDERFKVQLFRFIDVLPSLRSDSDVLKLLKEYFYGKEDLLPKSLKRWMPEKGLLGRIAGKTLKMNMESLAKQFIAGENSKAVLKPIEALRKEGRTFTVDLLGEAVLSDEEARIYQERYLTLIDRLNEIVNSWPEVKILDQNSVGMIPRVNISLKISSFYSHLDPLDFDGSIEEVKKGLRPIFEKAMNGGVSITFDMEHYQLKDITLAIFKSMLEEYDDFKFAGIAIQTYLKDCGDDLKELINWAREHKKTISVRLVKGAYWDYEKVINRQKNWPIPVYETKVETDSNFEEMTRLLLDNIDVISPAIASHNVRSIAHAMAYAESKAIPKEGIEFQALFGMAEPVKRAVTNLGYRVREYMPVGESLPGMAYLVRRLLENTSNESFLRQSFADDVDFDALMAKPEITVHGKEERIGAGEEGRGETRRGEFTAFCNLPLTDFSKEEMRESFRAALVTVREESATRDKIPCVIGGEKVLTDDEIISRNPAKVEEVVGIVSSASREDAEKAVKIARATIDEWRNTDPQVRANYLFDAANWIEERKVEIAALQILEVGKNWREADADVAEAIDFLNYYGEEMVRLSRPERLGDLPGEVNYHYYLPRGVCAVISPWNFPLAIACGMTAAALVSGNSVILKPSSQSPVTAYKLMESFEAAGLPKGVLQFLPGPGREVGDCLVEHVATDIIAFTGSMEVGLGIVERAGKTLPGQKNVKKVIAEMGGKNAIIVDGSADLDEAIKGVIDSYLGFQGQKCSACSRAIVLEEVYDAFLERLKEAVKSITIGSPEIPGNIMGPVIDSSALHKINKYIEIGKGEATLSYLCESVPDEGYFASPAIFSDVTPDSRLATEEIFGPVLSVIKAKDIDHAIEIANATAYALTGGIFSRSPLNINKASHKLMVGNLYINRKITGALVGRQPFGGFGMSGLGSKAGGKDYLLHFMNPKCITENSLRRGFAPEIE